MMTDDILTQAPFDPYADEYDNVFMVHPAWITLRTAVQDVVGPLIPDKANILEIGCGTGEDALWMAGLGHNILATDISDTMMRYGHEKQKISQYTTNVTFRHWDARRGLPDGLTGAVELVFSNFGAVNCIIDINDLADRLDPYIRQGQYVAFTLMGRFCLWDFVMGILRLKPKLFMRRLRGIVNWTSPNGMTIPVRYYGPTSIENAFGTGYSRHKIKAIGTALPPTYLFDYLNKHPRLCKFLIQTERILSKLPFSWAIADHYIIVLKKDIL